MREPAAYVSALQGRPWTPERHCWALVRDVQADLFGRALPAVLIDERPDALRLARLFRDHPEQRRWCQTDRPAHGAIVLMHRARTHARAIHAGVYLDLDGGGVLHVDAPQGVAFEDGLTLRLRGWACEFYLPR